MHHRHPLHVAHDTIVDVPGVSARLQRHDVGRAQTLGKPVIEVDQRHAMGRENRLLLSVDRPDHHGRLVDVEADEAGRDRIQGVRIIHPTPPKGR
jgi:hypothetical protein